MAALHRGKLDRRIETSGTEAMGDWIAIRAHENKVSKADFVRELVYMAATGEMYSLHVAKDRSESFKAQAGNVRDFPRTHTGDSGDLFENSQIGPGQ